MYVIAIIGDLFGMIPIVNIATDFITAITLGIVGSHTGVNIFSSKSVGATLTTIVVKAVPIVSIVPAWTIRVYFAKRAARLEQ